MTAAAEIMAYNEAVFLGTAVEKTTKSLSVFLRVATTKNMSLFNNVVDNGDVRETRDGARLSSSGKPRSSERPGSLRQEAYEIFELDFCQFRQK